MYKLYTLILISVIFILVSCAPDDEVVAVYDATPYSFTFPENFGDPELPLDNVLTIEGVKLGKMLFYEKALSKDGTQSCASCHVQGDGFSDKNRFSRGVDGFLGNRQAMPIFNLAWHKTGFFWDGRAATLRVQSLLPIQDPVEMHETLENVVSKLSADKNYTDQFVRAFGTSDINSTKLSLALEQFMMSIVSFDSKYDQFLAGKLSLTESEERAGNYFLQNIIHFFLSCPEQIVLIAIADRISKMENL